MTPRGTDWSLAALVALLAATRCADAVRRRRGCSSLHDVAGFALGGVLVWKLRRVWRRVLTRRLGLVAALFVAGTLATGYRVVERDPADRCSATTRSTCTACSARCSIAAVLAHALQRGRSARAGAICSAGASCSPRPASASARCSRWQRAAHAGLASAKRRFTGSYEVASFEGNAFPTTSWVADAPRALDPAPTGSRSATAGSRRHELDAGDTLTATLDCTGGFYSTQRWRGIRLDAPARRRARQPRPRDLAHRLPLELRPRRRAASLLLATHVGGEPLSHGHGAPVRLVAPGQRGFIWVKWVTRVELHDGPDPGALASTVWSSFTPRGRGS